MEEEVLPDRQLPVEGVGLRHDADDLLGPGRIGHDVHAADQRPPRGGHDPRGEHPDGGRLAGAVGAEEAEDLPRPDRQPEVVHGRDGRAAGGGERLRQAVGPDDLGRAGFCSGRAGLTLRGGGRGEFFDRPDGHLLMLRPARPPDQGTGGRVGNYPPVSAFIPLRSVTLMAHSRNVLVALLLVAGSACGTDLLKVETINPAPTTTTSTSTTTTTRPKPKPTTTTTRQATPTTVTTKPKQRSAGGCRPSGREGRCAVRSGPADDRGRTAHRAADGHRPARAVPSSW